MMNLDKRLAALESKSGPHQTPLEPRQLESIISYVCDVQGIEPSSILVADKSLDATLSGLIDGLDEMSVKQMIRSLRDVTLNERTSNVARLLNGR